MLKIGELAGQAGVEVSTVRYYERCGLLRPRHRNNANYRLYDQDDVSTLQFIIQAKRLGFTLREIRDLVFLDETEDTCADLNQFIQSKRADIGNRIEQLRRMDKALSMLLDTCPGNPKPGSLRVCPMWADLHSKNKPQR